MAYLTPTERYQLSDLITNTIGYDPEVRRVLLSDINTRFKALFQVSTTPQIQLDLDIIKLDNTPRLTDGIIPFEIWLNNALRYIKNDPEGSSLIQALLNKIGTIYGNQPKIINSVSPDATVMNRVREEKTVHRDDMVSFSFLESGVKAGFAVAKMKVTRYEGENAREINGFPAVYLGTGWLLTKNLLITNHHVIRARENNEPGPTAKEFELQAKNTVTEFDYDSENQVGVDVLVEAIVAMDRELDYAIFRITPDGQRNPVHLFPERIELPGTAAKVVNIIQHPLGRSKKVAIRNNHIYDTPYPSVRYFTDTEGGSSGSPVFNDNWEVIALHRAYNLVDNVQYMGQQTAWINEGIQIHAILAHLKANFNPIWKELDL